MPPAREIDYNLAIRERLKRSASIDTQMWRSDDVWGCVPVPLEEENILSIAKS
jgi:hypothetical protein